MSDFIFFITYFKLKNSLNEKKKLKEIDKIIE